MKPFSLPHKPIKTTRSRGTEGEPIRFPTPLLVALLVLPAAGAADVYKCTVTGLTFTDESAYGKHCPGYTDSNGDGLCDHLVLVKESNPQTYTTDQTASYGPGRGGGIWYNVPENAVAIYAPPRYVGTACIHAIESVLNEHGIPYVEVGHGWMVKYLTYNGKPTAKALILPDGGYVHELLTYPDVADAIRKYLNDGGVVIGICAGAMYLANAKLVDAKVIGIGTGRGGTVTVKFTGNDPFGLWNGLPNELNMAYINGLILEPTSSSAVVVAEYAGGVVNSGAAVIAEKVGNGLVVAIGPHPCYDVNGNVNEEGAKLLLNAINASTVQTVQPQPQWGPRPTGPFVSPPLHPPEVQQVQTAMIRRLSEEIQMLRERLRIMGMQVIELRRALASIPKPSWVDVLASQIVGPWLARVVTGVVTGTVTAAILSYLHLEPPLSLAAGALVGIALNVPI